MKSVLYLYDIPIPEDIDGRVLTEIIKDDYLKNHQIKYSEESSQTSVISKTIKINETTREEVEKKLKELGYIQ